MHRTWLFGLFGMVALTVCASACSHNETSKVGDLDRWAARMGEVEPIKVSGYDLVILDPDRSPKPRAIREAAPRTKLIARVAMAEAELGTAAWREAHDADYLIEEPDARLTDATLELRAVYPVEVRRAAWRRDLRARVAELLARGYDGVYFDGITGAVEREWAEPERWGGTRGALPHEVTWARHAHPDAILLLDVSRSISGDLPDVDGVVARGLYGGWDALRRQHTGARTVAERERLLRYLEEIRDERRLPVFVIDYIDAREPWRFAEACVKLRARGFEPYMAPPEAQGGERWSCI